MINTFGKLRLSLKRKVSVNFATKSAKSATKKNLRKMKNSREIINSKELSSQESVQTERKTIQEKLISQSTT